MPAAIMLTIHPVASSTVAANLARATHAAVLRLVAQVDSDLAAELHDGDGPKPLTVSNVLGMEGRARLVPVAPERAYGLRITALTPAVEAIVTRWSAEQLDALDLDGLLWRVSKVERRADEHRWAGVKTYDELAAPALLRGADGPHRWTFEFASPVTFRQRGMNQPLPTPDLVFGSLLEKWNRFAPIALPEELRRFAAECLAVSRFDLRSLAEPTKGGALQIGAVGLCTYTATNHDRYWLACLEPLAQFAFYSGVGAGTARGFGRTRLVENG